MSLGRHKQLIEEALERVIPTFSPLCQSLYEAGRYALLSGGKRIRPLLTLSTVEMLLPNDPEALKQAIQPACALECIHTYSLIHDDLPAMDNDSLRRGQPTVHCVYGEGHAILVGDYLLTYAFELLSSAPFLDDGKKVALIRSLATAAGGDGMVGGQVMDLEGSQSIDELHGRKTAALFSAAVEFGAIIASANADTISILRAFSLQFGTLFQLIDDIHDHDHPLGEEKAYESAHCHFRSAMNTLEKLPCNSSSLKKLCESLLFS